MVYGSNEKQLEVKRRTRGFKGDPRVCYVEGAVPRTFLRVLVGDCRNLKDFIEWLLGSEYEMWRSKVLPVYMMILIARV